MDRNPSALRCVVLVKLHSVDLGQIPFALHDERLAAGAKNVCEQGTVGVHVHEGKGSALHGILQLG
jgi:hypothetical protein